MNQNKKELLSQVKEYILGNLDKEMSVDAICTMFSISKTILQLLFREYYGIALHALILQLRMEKAKALLETGDDPIKSVAAQCGYTNIRSFTKAFKAKWKLSPYQYRKMNTQG